MTVYSAPPPELAQAIRIAASRYGVPVATLTGIWRIESGSSFPNPYVNSSGYGGLFGTTNWSASTQAQANTAASILARLLRENNGNMAAALHAYSGGGYTSVPGGGASVTVSPTSTGDASPRVRPGAGAGNQFTSWWVGPKPWTLPEKAWDAITGSIQGGWDVLKAFVWLADPRTWLRVVEFGTGSALMLLALRGLFLIYASKDTPVDYQTVGGAARSVRDRQIRPAYDQLVPGASNRRRGRKERRTKKRALRASAKEAAEIFAGV